MKRFVLRTTLAALILVTLSSGPQMVFGEVIFDNLAQSTASGFTFISSSYLRAQQFQTTATGYVLDSVTVRVDNTTSATGNFTLSVYTSPSNPGTSLGVFASRSWSGITAAYENVTLSGLLTLAPSTTYFMVMSVDSASNGQWGGASADPGLLELGSIDNGSSWRVQGAFPQMQVTAVPEPAMGTMAVGGLVAWWGLRRRGRRRLASGAAVTGNAA